MFIYGKSFSNQQYGHLMPPEDSYKFESYNCVDGSVAKAMVVSDGITRDPIGVVDFNQKDTIEERLETYPNPSGARFASNTFCENFVATVKSLTPSLDLVKTAFENGNKEIAKLNELNLPSPDYLENDLWGCVAVGGIVWQDKLYWGAITDSVVTVYYSEGSIKLRLEDRMAHFTQYLEQFNNPWHLPKGRVFCAR